LPRILHATALAALCMILPLSARAVTDGSGDPTAVQSDDGKWTDKDGTPTFKVEPDGTVDWYTYVGFTRYSSECLRCHGPDGAGSSYGPDLTHSLKEMSADEFKEVVVNGRKNVSTSVQNVMPPFGEVEDVMLYLDDIYGYLKARSDGVLDRGRPERFDR